MVDVLHQHSTSAEQNKSNNGDPNYTIYTVPDIYQDITDPCSFTPTTETHNNMDHDCESDANGDDRNHNEVSTVDERIEQTERLSSKDTYCPDHTETMSEDNRNCSAPLNIQTEGDCLTRDPVDMLFDSHPNSSDFDIFIYKDIDDMDIQFKIAPAETKQLIVQSELRTMLASSSSTATEKIDKVVRQEIEDSEIENHDDVEVQEKKGNSFTNVADSVAKPMRNDAIEMIEETEVQMAKEPKIVNIEHMFAQKRENTAIEKIEEFAKQQMGDTIENVENVTVQNIDDGRIESVADVAEEKMEGAAIENINDIEVHGAHNTEDIDLEFENVEDIAEEKMEYTTNENVDDIEAHAAKNTEDIDLEFENVEDVAEEEMEDIEIENVDDIKVHAVQNTEEIDVDFENVQDIAEDKMEDTTIDNVDDIVQNTEDIDLEYLQMSPKNDMATELQTDDKYKIMQVNEDQSVDVRYSSITEHSEQIYYPGDNIESDVNNNENKTYDDISALSLDRSNYAFKTKSASPDRFVTKDSDIYVDLKVDQTGFTDTYNTLEAKYKLKNAKETDYCLKDQMTYKTYTKENPIKANVQATKRGSKFRDRNRTKTRDVLFSLSSSKVGKMADRSMLADINQAEVKHIVILKKGQDLSKMLENMEAMKAKPKPNETRENVDEKKDKVTDSAKTVTEQNYQRQRRQRRIIPKPKPVDPFDDTWDVKQPNNATIKYDTSPKRKPSVKRMKRREGSANRDMTVKNRPKIAGKMKTSLDVHQKYISTGNLRSKLGRHKAESLREMRLLEEIHTGTFSTKFRGVYKNYDVVLSVYKKDEATTLDVQEMVTLGNCPFIVGIRDCILGPYSSLWFMSVYYHLGDLQYLLSRDYYRWLFGEKLAQFITAGVLLGVDYLHSRSIVHGNIKPSKILINNAGYPVLTGFQKMLDDDDIEPLDVFTPAYAAPERYRGWRIPSVDIFSVGCVAYEIINNSTPFDGGSTGRTKANIMKKDWTPLYEPDLFSFAGECFIGSCLCKNWRERFFIGEDGFNLLQEEWFSMLEWPKLKSQTMKSPLLDVIRILDMGEYEMVDQRARYDWGRVMDVVRPDDYLDINVDINLEDLFLGQLALETHLAL